MNPIQASFVKNDKVSMANLKDKRKGLDPKIDLRIWVTSLEKLV